MEFYKIISPDYKHPHYLIVDKMKMHRFDKDMKYIDLSKKNGNVFDKTSWINQVFLQRYGPMEDVEIAKLLLVFGK